MIERVVKYNANPEEYLIKWVGYPFSECTWEPAKNVPMFIQLYYKKDFPSNLGKPLPKPRIHAQKLAGPGDTRVLISWDEENGSQEVGRSAREWYPRDVFRIFAEDGKVCNIFL